MESRLHQMTSRELLEDLLQKADIDARLRSDAPDSWLAVWSSLPWQPVEYRASAIDYQTAYFTGACEEFEDISLVIQNDGKPSAIWPLSAWWQSGVHVGSCGGPVVVPLFGSEVGKRTAKRLFRSAIRFVQELSGVLGCHETKYLSRMDLPSEAVVSGWHHQLLAGGASIGVRHELTLNLERDAATIRAGFRRRYKSLVSAGLKRWVVDIQSGAGVNYERWNEFRRLHRTVAGRVTRTPLTWDLQWNMLRAREAFLVGLYDPQESMRMVGGGFFEITRDEAAYSVGVYDRTLFDTPLGHVVQARAIEEMKRLGLRRYVIGERPYPGDKPVPTPKELDIANFKQGFASHHAANFVLTLCAAGHER